MIGKGALVQRKWLSEQENKARTGLLQPHAQGHLCSAYQVTADQTLTESFRN